MPDSKALSLAKAGVSLALLGRPSNFDLLWESIGTLRIVSYQAHDKGNPDEPNENTKSDEV